MSAARKVCFQQLVLNYADFWRYSVFMQTKITHLKNVSYKKNLYFGQILSIFGQNNSLFMPREIKKK